MTTKKRKPLFERLKSGLEEGIAHARKEITLKTIVHVVEPPEIDAATIVALRNHTAMSQAVFAKLLSTSTKTVQSWEQGARVPSNTARRLLHLLVSEPAAMCRVAGLPPISVDDFVVKHQTGGMNKIVRRQKALVAKRNT